MIVRIYIYREKITSHMCVFLVTFVGIVEKGIPIAKPLLSFDAPKGEHICSVFGCNEKVDSTSLTKLFPLPSCTPTMSASHQHIELKRRQAWLDSIECNTAAGEKIKICGKHFHFGTKSFNLFVSVN